MPLDVYACSKICSLESFGGTMSKILIVIQWQQCEARQAACRCQARQLLPSTIHVMEYILARSLHIKSLIFHSTVLFCYTFASLNLIHLGLRVSVYYLATAMMYAEAETAGSGKKMMLEATMRLAYKATHWVVRNMTPRTCTGWARSKSYE
jgi:hypothetical protein